MNAPLLWPVEPYRVSGYAFGERVRSRVILWARHLGDDVVVPAGTPVAAIADGEVVWAEVRPGSLEHRNWGGIVVVRHEGLAAGREFYSLYGHITNITVKTGDAVRAGSRVGEVAAGNTPENGWWKLPHLHFGIYVGPWTKRVLPGYKRFFDDRTKFHWWRNPGEFIENYNSELSR